MSVWNSYPFDRDPYSPKRGFWFSHMGWILHNYPSGVNEFTNAKDLGRDPIAMFQHRFYLPLTLAMNSDLLRLVADLIPFPAPEPGNRTDPGHGRPAALDA